MNFGVNLYNWMSSNAQSLVLLAIIFIALYIMIEKKMSKLVGWILVGVCAVGFVYNTTGVKDLFLQIFNTIIK